LKIKNKKFEIEFIGDTQLKKFLRASKDRLKKLSEYFQILHQNEDQTMITIKIVSNEEIKILNKKFRKKNKVTDVLSFPDEHASGDIAIADSYILNKNQTINAQNFFMLVGHGFYIFLVTPIMINNLEQYEIFREYIYVNVRIKKSS